MRSDSGLRKNICSLSYLSIYRSAVEAQLLEERIPPELQYAYTHWVHHQTNVDLESNGMNDI